MSVHHTFVTATLLCLSMGFSSLAHAAVCDVDTDGDVDRLDLSLIIGARKTPAGGPDDPRDADGDGTITVLDARTCVRQCTLPRCATVPTPTSPTDNAGQLDAADTTPIQKTVKDASKPNVATSDQLSTDIQGRTIVSGTEWKVKHGDTLYAIGRAVYPGDARKQARLRRDITKLNPSVFANGANNMAVGAVLKLPDYVVPKSAPPKVGELSHVPMPVPVEITPKPPPQPAAPATVVEPVPETLREAASAPKSTVKSEPVKQVKKEPSTVRGQPASAASRAEGGVLVSLGFSYGGDVLVDTDGLLDISAGSGGHLRLGYEKMPHHGSGYRLALGLQYNETKDVSFRDTYLQLAYQYRANPFVYGIGVVSHAGATLEVFNITTDYDTANGVVVYLENVGSGKVAGWGLSYIALDIEEKGTATSVDASRAEFYYSWRF
jgi:hypothetical protein